MKYVFTLLAALLASPALAGSACNLSAPVVDDATKALMQQNPSATKKFLEQPECFNWVGFYTASQLMFNQGLREDAIMWFYAGQIRARIAAGIDPDPSRSNALLTALNQGIGHQIMTYAARDKDVWQRQIEMALEWDVNHPLQPEPMTVLGDPTVTIDPRNFALLYDEVRQGLQQMRDSLSDEEIDAIGEAPEQIDLER